MVWHCADIETRERWSEYLLEGPDPEYGPGKVWRVERATEDHIRPATASADRREQQTIKP